MPYFVVKYIDDKLDIRSPLTLYNYVRDYLSPAKYETNRDGK